MGEQTQRFYRFGDYKIEKSERLLTRQGLVVPLPPKAIDLLLVLLESNGRVVTKEELMNVLWADSFVEEANLSRNVFQLRKVLGEGPDGVKFIETIPKRGYRFAASVSQTDGGEELEFTSRERTLSQIVVEEIIETDYPRGEEMITDRGQLGLPPRISRSLTLFILGSLSIFLIAASVAGYFMLWPRHTRQYATIGQQRLVSTFPGSHSSPSFSPDGQRIVFINEVNGARQVWTRDLAGGEPVRITSGEDHAERPRWSPAGDEIVYVRHADGKPSIWRIRSEGGEPQKVIEGGRNPNWSGDGKQLVFERGYDVWTANRDGSEQRRIEGVPPTDLLLTDRMPAFSPDGASIVFFQNDKGPIGDYWIIATSGGDARRLTFDNIFGGAPVWMPDGESIIFPSQRAGSMTLWRVPVAGGHPEPVLTGAGEDTAPEISRDGRRLIYANTRNAHVLIVTDPATGESREIMDSRVDIVDPSFSPDGSQILFFGINDEGDIHIFKIGSDGKDLMQVTQGKGERNIHPQWSLDGSTIYFYQFHPTFSFRRIAAGGGESVELVSGWQWGTHNGARVGPEGRRIIYSKMDKGVAVAAMVRDIATGAETAFTLPLRHARWSRDGRFIAGTTVPDGKRRSAEVVVCHVETDACRTVAKGSDPHWSADESLLYFTPFSDFDGESVWSVSREGDGEKKIIDLRPMHPIGDFFDVSPQDQIVWVQYKRGESDMWLADFPAQ